MNKKNHIIIKYYKTRKIIIRIPLKTCSRQYRKLHNIRNVPKNK